LSASLGGVVVRFDAVAADGVGLAALAFLPAEVARRVALASGAIALGGAPPLALGLALVEGRLLTLVAVGAVEARGPIVICERPEGGAFALGVQGIVGTGVFDGGDEGVHVDGGFAPLLDVVELLQRIEAAVWVTRAPRSPSSLPPPSPPPHPTEARGA
jgi:hypothetical protein